MADFKDWQRESTRWTWNILCQKERSTHAVMGIFSSHWLNQREFKHYNKWKKRLLAHWITEKSMGPNWYKIRNSIDKYRKRKSSSLSTISNNKCRRNDKVRKTPSLNTRVITCRQESLRDIKSSGWNTDIVTTYLLITKEENTNFVVKSGWYHPN